MKAVEHDNRSGSLDTPYGFVYFDDGKRVVYAKGVGEFDGVSLGTGGWAPVTMDYVKEAQRYLAEVFGADWNTRKSEEEG